MSPQCLVWGDMLEKQKRPAYGSSSPSVIQRIIRTSGALDQSAVRTKQGGMQRVVEEGFPEKMTADLTLEKQEVLRPRRKSSQISGNIGQNIQPVCSGSPGLIPKPAAGPCHHSRHRHSPDSPQEHMYKHRMNKLTTCTHAFFL